MNYLSAALKLAGAAGWFFLAVLFGSFCYKQRNHPDFARQTDATIDGFVVFTAVSGIVGMILFNEDSEEAYFVSLIPLSLLAAIVGYFGARAREKR
jgi:hypothetical protein